MLTINKSTDWKRVYRILLTYWTNIEDQILIPASMSGTTALWPWKGYHSNKNCYYVIIRFTWLHRINFIVWSFSTNDCASLCSGKYVLGSYALVTMVILFWCRMHDVTTFPYPPTVVLSYRALIMLLFVIIYHVRVHTYSCASYWLVFSPSSLLLSVNADSMCRLTEVWMSHIDVLHSYWFVVLMYDV